MKIHTTSLRLRSHLLSAGVLLGAILFASSLVSSQDKELDIAPFARRCCVTDQFKLPVAFDYAEARRAGTRAEKAADGRYIYGLQWTEERDVREVKVQFRPGSSAQQATLEYWFKNWPYPPPHMPSTEDPVDDPWQGRWLKAAARVTCEAGVCVCTFLPLDERENPNAKNLPGLDYRRALKLRLVFQQEPSLESVQVFSGTRIKPVEVRVELGAGESAGHLWSGKARVYNGALKELQLWNGAAGDNASGSHFQVKSGGRPKGLLLKLDAAEPSLPGSNDVTIVTLDAGERAFSFAVPDLQKGPIYIPGFHAYVTKASDQSNFSPSIVKKGEKIREKLAKEPEQSYERASREIPPLDPVERQWGGRLYLPLAADASWQKFAFEWGGNIHISKEGTKAKGKDLQRLEWAGDQISWRLGTGSTPNYRPRSGDSKLTVLEDDLPVAEATWSTEGIDYAEEGFATLLSGPLSPDDSGRSEQTPAVLMVKLTARNRGHQPGISHLWLATVPDEQANYENGELTSQNGELLRARLKLPGSAHAELAVVPEGSQSPHGVHITIPLGPDETQTIFISLPFIPRLKAEEHTRFASLDYDTERGRVVSYWKDIIERAVPFQVPERRFDSFARAVMGHIRISATKDPQSGLYMVPAASYVYQVFANEASFQCVMLDALGEHKLAEEYLETFVRLQGSKPFDGTYEGDQRAVYHGARVDADDDYTASQYNLDHGVVLWALGEHYFFTHDQAWLRRTAPSMMRAADWVVAQRKLTQLLDGGEKIPEYGLLPAGHLEDNNDWGHWFSVNAFAALGMTRLAQALTEIRAPEAEHYTQAAAAYTRDLRDAVARSWRLTPVIRLRDNSYVPYVPTKPYQRLKLFGPLRVGYYSRYPEKILPTYRLSAVREVLYGPMILLATDVFHASEPIAGWVLDDWEDNETMSTSLGLFVHGWVDDAYWFSRGGMVFQPNLQNPIFVYLRRNEVPAAIRNLYNDFVACYYPTVNAFTEEFRQWREPSGPFYKIPDESKLVNRVRDLLVREEGDTLWLAAGTPRRWLAPGEKIEAQDAPSYFGPVTYHIEAGETSVNAQVELPQENSLKSAILVLRTPARKVIRSVDIDGKPWKDFEAATGRIRLPMKAGKMEVVARY